MKGEYTTVSNGTSKVIEAFNEEDDSYKQIAQLIVNAENYAAYWKKDLEERRKHELINGEGLQTIYDLTNRLRNQQASRQAMRLISNEVRRLHNLADEAHKIQADFSREAIERHTRFTEAVFDLNKAVVELAERMLKLEEDSHVLSPTDKAVAALEARLKKLEEDKSKS